MRDKGGVGCVALIQGDPIYSGFSATDLKNWLLAKDAGGIPNYAWLIIGMVRDEGDISPLFTRPFLCLPRAC